MKEDAKNTMADLAYFRALAAKTLVEHAVNLLSMHMDLVEQMRIDYHIRRKEMEKKYREKRKQENPEVSIPCDICGGSYLPHHKKRHISSNKHQSKLTE